MVSKSFEELMEEKLASIPDTLDKRQGSIIYDTLAPNAAESAQLYFSMALLMDRTFADTATGEDLTRRAAERNILREEAVAAIVEGKFYDLAGKEMDIPVGSRFSGGGVTYLAATQLEKGVYALQCETAGEIGNQYIGRLLPIEYIENLAVAQAERILRYGQEEESDEKLRSRYMASFTKAPFGGNIDDYKEKINSFDRVGGCKVVPVWNGGGTVKVVIINNGFRAPEAELVAEIQTAVDPGQEGLGYGIAPIGHRVTVVAVEETEVTIAFTVTMEEGRRWDTVAQAATEAIAGYIEALASDWENRSQLVVRISQIETQVLEIDGIIDVTGTTLNGQAENLTLGEFSIPVLKEVLAQ